MRPLLAITLSTLCAISACKGPGGEDVDHLTPGLAELGQDGEEASVDGPFDSSEGLSAPAESTPALLRGVMVERSVLDLRSKDNVTIWYELGEAADVGVDLINESGFVVRTFRERRDSGGLFRAIWDGKTESGEMAEDGVYRFALGAYGADGTWVSLHEPNPGHGRRMEFIEYSHDKKAGRLQWLMPQAGMTRLYVRLLDWPLLRILLDWVPLEAGWHSLNWDGMDATGLVRLAEHPDLYLGLSGYTLPENSIIVRGGTEEGLRVEKSVVPRQYAPLHHPDAGHFHATHPREECATPRFTVDFPESPERDEEGRVILSGETPLRVRIHPEDAPRLLDAMFEVAVYVDLVFLWEEEDSVNPITYVLDTSALSDGPHILTVNLFSYDDHIGFETMSVVVRNDKQD